MTRNKVNRYQQVGLDRVIRLDWLQMTANLILAGNGKGSVKESLQEILQETIPSSGSAVRGTLSKTITILMKVWVNVPKGLGPFRDNGLTLIRSLPPDEQMPVHWGMIMAAYPFWGAVAGTVGRLLRLQGSVAAPHVQRRMREVYGERETVSRRVRYLLRSFISWGVLAETSNKGLYHQGEFRTLTDTKMISWLVEASLHARPEGQAPYRDLIENPNLFPFRLAGASADSLSRVSTHLEFVSHGLDEDLVLLKQAEELQ